jgi:F-type H+-transporting ATPase subunit delta
MIKRNSTHKPLAIRPGQRQVALLYAQSFLAVAEKSGQVRDLIDELTSLVTDVLDAFPRFEVLLSIPYLKVERKIAMLERVLGGRASPLVLNFLKVLAKNERLGALRSIVAALRDLYDARQGRVRVEVRTPQPLREDSLTHVTNKLRSMLGKEPVLEGVSDPEMIGGIVLRVGDTVYDASVAARLARLREDMIHRSVHEIQSRRDRFCHPTGN